MLKFLVHEIREAAFPMLFFLVVFEIGVVTKALLLDPYNIGIGGLAIAAVAAATVTKAILIADNASFANHLNGRPLVFAILWKSLIFGCLALLFRFLEEVIHFWVETGELTLAMDNLAHGFTWAHFWVMQLWLSIALVLFTSLRAIDRRLGEGSLRRLMFGSA